MRVIGALMLWSAALLGSEGGRAGNGFAVFCREEASHGLREGYYSLDYLVTLGLGPSRQVESWAESAARIRKLMAGVLGRGQMESFEDFVANVRNTDDYTRKRIWEAAPFGVLNLKAEAPVDNPDNGPVHKEQIKSNLKSLVTKLPKACQTADGDVELVPAVVFQDSYFTGRPEGYLVYKFVPGVLNELEVTDPLQLSYLYIHEWLWDISNNEDRNRRINQLLHSERIDALSVRDIRTQLEGMGLALGTAAQASPRLGAEALREAYDRTEIPAERRTVREVLDVVYKSQRYLELDYTLHALRRTCSAPGDCTPWEGATPVWKDLRGGLTVPPAGKLMLKAETNLYVFLKSTPVEGARVSTECPVDHADRGDFQGDCRKMWAVESALEPTGWIFVGDTAPDLKVRFTPQGVWVGGHAARGNEEVRLAFFAPYLRSRPPRVEEGFFTPGDHQLENGRYRRVIDIPADRLPGQGTLTGDTTYPFATALDLPGGLRALRAHVLYENAMDTLGMDVISPHEAKYGYHSNADPGTADCRRSFQGRPACFLELRPGFAHREAAGPWKFTFSFAPRRKPVRIYALQILFETAP